MCAISSTFSAELDSDGAFFLPWFGTCTKEAAPGKAGQMVNAFGRRKAIPPVLPKTEIIPVPFHTLIEVRECSGLAPLTTPGVSSGSAAPSAPSGSAPSGSVAPVAHVNLGRHAGPHAETPEVIAAPGKNGPGSDAAGSDSSSASEKDGEWPKQIDAGALPAAALLGPF
eukprot:4543236-Pyramimonas_sp.AAC.1